MSQFAHIALMLSSGLLASLWEGALIVAVVWIALRLLRSLSAATRYIIWLSTLATLVLIPVLTVVHAVQNTMPAPHLSIATTHPIAPPHLVAQSLLQPRTQPQQQHVPLPTHVRMQPVVAAPPSIPAHQPTRITIPEYLAFALTVIWLLIAVARGLVLARDFRELSAIHREAEFWSSAYEFPVFLSLRTHVPIAVGCLHPAIILPATLIDDLSAKEIESILTHETAHLHRFDVWTNAIARILECLLAYNPATWIISRQLTVAREIACDDWVVTREGAGVLFARTLATLASTGYSNFPLAAPSAIGSRNSILIRIEQLLDAHPRHLRPSLVALGGALMILPIIAILLQSISPVLAFAAQPTLQPHGNAMTLATDCQANRTIQISPTINIPQQHWYSPATTGAIVARFGATRVATVALTVDANGTLRNITVLSHPNYPGTANFVMHSFKTAKYKPAIENCQAVSSTLHTAMAVATPIDWSMSQVVPDYPNGWSNQHPTTCKVPDLIHAGTPANQRASSGDPVGLPQFPASLNAVTAGKNYVSSVRIHIKADGTVESTTLTSSSGIHAFDAALLTAARSQSYPLTESTGFKAVRPSNASLAWNATHGSSTYTKCRPLPTDFIWTTTFTRIFPMTLPGSTINMNVI